MGEAAAAQLEAVRSELTNLEPTSDEARALGSISSDLDLFVEQSAKQRGKVSYHLLPTMSIPMAVHPHCLLLTMAR